MHPEKSTCPHLAASEPAEKQRLTARPTARRKRGQHHTKDLHRHWERWTKFVKIASFRCRLVTWLLGARSLARVFTNMAWLHEISVQLTSGIRTLLNVSHSRQRHWPSDVMRHLLLTYCFVSCWAEQIKLALSEEVWTGTRSSVKFSISKQFKIQSTLNHH